VIIKTISILKKQEKIFVTLNARFFEEIETHILQRHGTLSKFNKKYFGIDNQTFSWPFRRKTGIQLKRLDKISRILRLDYASEIIGFYTWGSHNKPYKIPLEIKIDTHFVEGYALYIGEGDTGLSGKKQARKVRLTNAEPNVIHFFEKWMLNIFPDIKTYSLAIIPFKNKELRSAINTAKIKYGKYNKKVKYRICADNAIIIDLILKINVIVKKECLKNKKLAKAYLRGIMAAEGTVYHKGNFKYIRIEMKNPSEISYVKKLFSKLDISVTHHSRSNREKMESLYIGGKEKIYGYFKLVGFGCEKNRQTKLKHLISTINKEKNLKAASKYNT
jgi:hypothetical protein